MKNISGRFGVLFTLIAMIAASGCADMVTYSRDSREHGMSLYTQGNYADAAGAFRNTAKQNPRDYGAYYMLGCSYEQLGQHQQAIQSFRTSLDVQKVTLQGNADDAQRVKTISALAAAIARSDSRDIETNAAVAEARTTQSPYAYLLLAEVYGYRGDADSAIDAYQQAALLAPENFNINKVFGLYLEKLGQTQRCEAPLRRAYAINPGDEQVNDALRRVGVVPGPSIKDRSALVKPPLPQGPLPQLDLSKIKFGGAEKASSTTTPPPAPPTGGTVQAPRD